MHEQEVLALLRAGDERGAEALLRALRAADALHHRTHRAGRAGPRGVPFRRRAGACGRNSEPTIPRAARGRRGSRRSRATPRSTARGKSPAAARSFPGDLPSAEPTPEERLLQQERRQALERALTALPQRDRLLFYRKYYYRQSTAQIAAELGTTERAVEGRLYRIKKALRKALGGDDA